MHSNKVNLTSFLIKFFNICYKNYGIYDIQLCTTFFLIKFLFPLFFADLSIYWSLELTSSRQKREEEKFATIGESQESLDINCI